MINKKKNSDNKVLTIIICFLIIFCGLGMIQPRGLFVVPITTALDISRSVYSLTDTIRSATTAIISVFFGVLVEKFGTKILICAGFVACALASLMFALAGNIVLLYLGSFLLGVGMAWTSSAIIGYVLTKVCTKNRGTILGIVFSANGIGGAVFAQVYAHFLESKEKFGYRNAYYFMVIVAVCILLLVIFLYRNPAHSPQEQIKKQKRAFTWEGIEFKQAKKTVYFYIVCACVFITGFSLQGLSSVRAAYMSDVGINVAFVATISSIGAISLAISKLINGFIYDKTGIRTTVTIGAVCSIIAIGLLFFLSASITGMVLSVIYAILFAVALPLETIMISIYANELFGEKSFGKVIGVLTAMHYIGSALSSPAMNLIYDLSGSYKLAFIMLGALMTVMLITIHIAISSARKLRFKIANGVQEESKEILIEKE